MRKTRIAPVSKVTVLTVLFAMSIGLLGRPGAAAPIAGDWVPGSVTALPSADVLAPYVVVLRDGVDSSTVASLHALTYGAQVSYVYKYAISGYAATIPTSAIGAIESDPDVLFMAADRDFAAAADPFPPPPAEQPPQSLSNGVRRVGGDLSSTRSGDGSGSVLINVAVLDTGIDTLHPDLNVVGGVDCASGGGGIDDLNGHGTFVAGLIGAKDNAIGRVGVAPDARLWSVRVLGKTKTGSDSHIICGIDWVTSTRVDADPSNDIAVANMSLLGPGQDDGNCGLTIRDPLHRAICGSVAAGVTYVVAAGNDTQDIAKVAPAGYHEVLTATAIADYDGQPGGLATPTCADLGADDAAATFSNFATLAADKAHVVAAPGVCLGSTYPHSNYAILFFGTSFASPLVAGTVALCITSGPCSGLTPSQIVQKIVSDAAAYNNKNRNFDYGFSGDPLRPTQGRYYGFLIRAALY